jgi:hypothetical protein
MRSAWKPFLLATLLVAAGLFLTATLPGSLAAAAEEEPPATAAGPCLNAALSPELPHEVAPQGGSRQDDFDCFSWRSLVAVNWAAGASNGEPDRSKPFGQLGRDGQVVWTTYKQPAAVFLPAGANPCDCDTSQPACRQSCWNAPPRVPSVCSGLAATAPITLTMSSKTGNFADAQVQAVPNVWLTDQRGNLVRYDVRMNQDVFDFTAARKYYDGRSQWANPSATFDMPAGENGGPVGPVNTKAAWKIVSPEEESRFFTLDAVVVDTRINPVDGYADPKNGVYMTCNRRGEGPCCVRRVGLVGFHIAHKVKGSPQWVWSTFEQQENAPLAGQPPDPLRKYSFNNQSCGTGPECRPNQNPRKAKIPVKTPVQVERVVQKDDTGKPVPLVPRPVNEQWRALVRGTVWQNYVLVSTQWPDAGKPVPQYLANTTMETYNQVQGPSVPAKYTSSCMFCHKFASGLNGKPGDFSYLFSKAQPRKPVSRARR